MAKKKQQSYHAQKQARYRERLKEQRRAEREALIRADKLVTWMAARLSNKLPDIYREHTAFMEQFYNE